jgi:hypothetical protein
VNCFVEANVSEKLADSIFKSKDGDNAISERFLLPTNPHGHITQKNIFRNTLYFSFE